MIQYTEKRSEYRELQKVPALVQEVNDMYIYGARMVNFNTRGVHIETDTIIEVGTDIIIGIEDSTFISPSASLDSPKFYQAKIMWKKKLNGGLFNYSYGTKFISFNDQQNQIETNSILRQEYRKHPRKRYPKPVIFSSMNQYYKGLISNISLGGAFIKTRGKLKVGQTIKLIIPGKKADKCLKLKGKVMRFNESGVGIIFKSIVKKNGPGPNP